MPVDLSAFAMLAEQEWFFPPGIFLECRKESMESVGKDEETGEELNSKMLEVTLRVPRPAGVKSIKDKGKDGA